MMMLFWYQWMALAALGVCLLICLLHFFRLISLGAPGDYSRPAGKTGEGIRYAFTGAMSPGRKESAFLHLPTYTAGLLYHMGNFLSFFLFFFIICGLYPSGVVAWLIIAFLFISSLSGIGILIKRIVRKELRALSNPDDYISNILVTLFQILTILIILTVLPSYSLSVQLSNCPTVQLLYYLLFTLLALYIPVGKLRHTVYFFAARYHLGYFFGRRGVWPAGKIKS
jgi:hypothetical protein